MREFRTSNLSKTNEYDHKYPSVLSRATVETGDTHRLVPVLKRFSVVTEGRKIDTSGFLDDSYSDEFGI
jgi:hypothetical protein